MPGKNSRPKKLSFNQSLMIPYVPEYILTLIVSLAIIGRSRYYYFSSDHWKYSNECYLWTIFFIVADTVAFRALWRTRSEDPGFLIPLKERKLDKNHPEVLRDRVCAKCGMVKHHSRIHHCSRCGRCCEFMDHHCVFADNCIGKRNIKFFV